MEKATFGAGCFWCIEDDFRKKPGVINTTVGYSGGEFVNPTYEDVCSGKTGHAEVIEIEYNPEQISYEQLLDEFWSIHDPTTMNKQGPDVGTQYRSVVFYHTPQQQEAASQKKDELEQSGRFQNPIVTQILPAGPFYKAEEYHQQYMQKQREQ